MTSRNRQQEEEFSGLRELDRIVSQVLEAIRTPGDERPPARGRPRVGNVIYNDDWLESEAPDQEITAEPEPAVEPGVDEEAPDFTPLFADDVQPAADYEGGVLSEQECTFVERTARWLERRDNKDVILNAIWRRVLASAAAGADELPTDGDTAAPLPERDDGEVGTDD